MGCRGYRSEDCPKGIDVDVAQYMSGLVPQERGISWTIKECLYGNEAKERKPIQELKRCFDEYPGLEEIVLGVENLVVRRGQHASGVILYNKTPFDTAAIMKSPNGDLTTQFDLLDAEEAGDVKFDFLVTEICDKISTAIDLLQNDGYFEKDFTKRQIYDKYLHPQVLNLKDQRIWDALAAGTVQDVFQFNSAVGLETVKAIKPQNPIEMCAANGLMRLVAPEGQERPFDRYIKFKKDISLWYQEMDEAGLTKEEQQILEPYYLQDYGVPTGQEALMKMTMDPKISNFTLAEANNTRKVLAKKKVKEIPKVKEKFLSQCPSVALGNYAWKTMMEPQMSYSFSLVHSTLYTFVGIQTLVLAVEYPSIYWDTACLIVNSQSIEDTEINDDDEDEDEENETEVLGKNKKKQRAVDYGKIASALSTMQLKGMQITLPDINESAYTFTPDAKNNVARYGISGIVKIGADVVKEIMANRPYSSVQDFLSKVKVSRPQMVNLIKAGCFDHFGDRTEIMRQYISFMTDTKKRLTLQNMSMLINKNLLPPQLNFQIKVFNFNKYLKKNKISTWYALDEIAFNFYSKNFDLDLLAPYEEDNYFWKIPVSKWDAIYKKQMDPVREYLKKNQEAKLKELNDTLIQENWDKSCQGSLSQWEMDSVSYYFHPHELSNLDKRRYGLQDFTSLPLEPQIDKIFSIRGKKIPLMKLSRIAGTVLSKNKTKKTVTLLTTTGVVTVKIFGNVFSSYDKQISEKGADGKKHVIEKSWFSRGNKIIVTGIRRGDNFIAKKYKNTPYPLVELITQVNEDGTVRTRRERADEI